MHDQLAAFEASGRTEGVVFIGRAQEKTTVFRTEKRRNAQGRSYPWIVRSTGMVNHFYFYCLDDDFGPFFLKFCSYFPYTAKLCLNGHHWAQRQAAKAGAGFTAMDNAFAAVDDVETLQAICDALGPTQIYALLEKWLTRLPDPFTAADRAAGYRYQVSVLQAEFSLTQMLDAPVSGRVFFEHVIRDNLDVGRADKVGLIFGRRILHGRKRSTQPRFRTRVITDGVTPSLHADYKNTTIKQYHKEGRALRTETTINDSWDFRVRKGLGNLPALREIGFAANRRLLGVQRLDHDPLLGAQQLHHVCDPVVTTGGTTDPRPAARPDPQPCPALRTTDLPDPARRVHQPRPARAERPAPRPRPGHRDHRPDHLRPAPTPKPRPDRAKTPQPSLPRHRQRPTDRDVPDPSPRPTAPHRLGSTDRSAHIPPAPNSRHRLPTRPRHPRRTERTRRLTNLMKQNLTPISGFAGFSHLAVLRWTNLRLNGRHGRDTLTAPRAARLSHRKRPPLRPTSTVSR